MKNNNLIKFIFIIVALSILRSENIWASKVLPEICKNIKLFSTQEVHDDDPSLEADYILVDKSNRILYLFKNNILIYRFNDIHLGIEPTGHKQIEGDYKTPEGSYYIKNKKRSAKYLISLEVSYPNNQDKEFADTIGKDAGSDIMIHGFPQNKNSYEFEVATTVKDWTRGCIALTDTEIKIFNQKVEVRTPIDICP